MKRTSTLIAAAFAAALIAPIASASDLTINVEGIKDGRADTGRTGTFTFYKLPVQQFQG